MKSRNSRYLLIFDLDGVLVDTEAVAIRQIGQILGGLGVALSLESIADLLMGSERMIVIQDLLASVSKLPPSDLAARIESQVQEAILHDNIAIPGMFELMDTLDNCDLALATATPLTRFHAIDKRLALGRRFSTAIYLSQCSEFRKGEAAFYGEIAQDRRVQPTRCIVIDDNPVAIKAAVKAGMRAVGFVGGAHSTEGIKERLRKSGAIRIASEPQELSSIIADLISD